MPSLQFTNVDSGNREITYRRPDGTFRTLTLLDAPGQETDEEIAAAFQNVIQITDIDVEFNLADLPLDDPEHRDNFQNFNAAVAFFEATYPSGNVFLDTRPPGNQWWRITRNEVVSVIWDAANSVYQVKVSTVG